MKFLQVHSFYDWYLGEFYRQRPEVSGQPFEAQIRALLDDSFSGSHLFAPYLSDLGYQTQLVVANCQPAQLAWCNENKFFEFDASHWVHQIVKKQIDTFKPDILYLSHPIDFDSRFVRALSWRPRLIMGWRAAFIPPACDFSDFNVILSSIPACREKALRHGAQSVRHFTPGFCEFVAERVKAISPNYDVVFSGQWSPEHQRRNQFLYSVADGALSEPGGFSLAYFLVSRNPAEVPEYVRRVDKGARWAMDMFRALREGRIAINALIDLAEGNGGNMREFETTGVGTFLLTEEHPTLRSYFEPGVEVETFQNVPELLEKIRYYLAYPQKRQDIARRGQERCLRDHSMSVRTREFAAIIKDLLASKSS